VKTDQRIVRTMAELLRVQGYAATGLQQLARAAHAPTGSIYHHFPGGKREIAAAALRQAGAAYIQLLLPMLLDEHADLATAIEAAFTAAADDIANTGWANMCPVGTIAGEIADTEPELRLVAAEVIASWIDVSSQYLVTRGLSETDARTAMYALLTALEGGFLLARAQHAVETPARSGLRRLRLHRHDAGGYEGVARSPARPIGARRWRHQRQGGQESGEAWLNAPGRSTLG
jgi:AcrR family transcriptional regulator